jgi:DNA-binding GntR family transcriptional regulator
MSLSHQSKRTSVTKATGGARPVEQSVTTRWPQSGSALQLADTIADAIVDAVAQGSLEPGQRVVEAGLAKQFAVSRVPIREAIKILQAQGILKVTPNRGARVIAIEDHVVDEIFELRVALERIAVRGAVAGYKRDPRQLDALRDIVSRMERLARWDDWVEFCKCDVAFHREMCRVSRNGILLNLWEAIARHITIIFGRELASERNFDMVIRQHKSLIHQLEAGHPQIEQIIEDHILRLRRGNAMQRLTREGTRSARP